MYGNGPGIEKLINKGRSQIDPHIWNLYMTEMAT